MGKMIFVSLPVTDVPKSTGFYEALGFTRNPAFSDDTTSCMVWSEAIYFMVVNHERWKTFTDRPIPPSGSSEMQLTLTCDERGDVDKMNQTAAAHGGTGDINPPQDHGFMYARDFLDPDGHCLSATWMDPAAVPPE
ncbi:MAG: VOC family protein [Novosphingobium sp.]